MLCQVKRSCVSALASRAMSVLSLEHMNPRVKEVQYAVRGPIVQRATAYEQQLAEGLGGDLPFTEVIKANIGDCQAMEQEPITYIRQVLAACMLPSLMQQNMFPEDVCYKARKILSGCPGGSLGSYSDSTGHMVFRKDVVGFIERRDGFPSCVDKIIMSNGASEIIKLTLLTATFGHGQDLTGVMIPIPQYPLYSATLSEVGAQQVNYYLDEANGWSMSIEELQKSYDAALNNCTPRVLCVLNPGNPTGQVLSRQNIDAVIKFAAEKNLILLADEVYQDNIWSKELYFCSFKKALLESPYKDSLELASFHSMSKGFMGECGIRGGYGEFVNFNPDVLAELKKLKSAQLCSAISGQAAISIITDPPIEGRPSYPLFKKEKDEVLSSLHRKADKVYETFSKMPGITVNPVLGAMYCFPKIDLPPKAIAAAKEKDMTPDFMYVEQLLDSTGICVVPGSGFGQLPGTHHFRTTILPPEDKMDRMMEKFEHFHLNFLEKYS
jgi:alanine transaminase